MNTRESLRPFIHTVADVALAVAAGALVIAILPLHFALMGIKLLIQPDTTSPLSIVRVAD